MAVVTVDLHFLPGRVTLGAAGPARPVSRITRHAAAASYALIDNS